MTIDYCLPIISSGKQEIVETIHAQLDEYRYFEVWLDYVEGIDTDFAKSLAGELGDRLVVTFRRKGLEAPKLSADIRRGLLDTLALTPALIDLDVVTQADDIGYLVQSDGPYRLIASYHNYDETPDTLQLRKIIDTIKAYRPAVYKLSTLCRTEGDAVRLLQLLLDLKEQGVRAVISGMGDKGSATRVFGPLWGSEMAFAPLSEDDGSAPGQLTRQQLEKIFKELSK